MSEKPTQVKHITATCPVEGCSDRAFVQVLKFKDADTQKKVDRKARLKLRKQLTEWHEEGRHGR